MSGRGIVLKSELDISEDIQSGTLVSVLEQHLPPPTPLQMMFPPGRAQPRRVAALAEQIVRAMPKPD
ncbi:LysR family transcriptional regulator [Roseibium sp. TrichSKD4]|nr:LysR family transcriptional regulator [Roseibium sp. TrichSKD4]